MALRIRQGELIDKLTEKNTGFKEGLSFISAMIQILTFYSSYLDVFYLMKVFFWEDFS
jgi:hypothetical protein